MKISLPHFGRRTKKHLQRVLSLLVTVCLCLSMLPQTAEAWKILSHVNSADLILLELQRSQTLTGKASITINAPYENGTAYTYQIPDEYWEALRDYPNEFRAGSMGPDLYPDLLTGQGYIHPYYEKTVEGKTYRVGSGEWIKALCDSVNCMPRGNDRKKAIAFMLGYMLHYCGDQFGHDFINCFAGGTYPDLSAVNYSDTKDKNLNIILSHMSEESFMDGLVNWSFLKANGYLNTSAPTRFVADSMLYNGISNNSEAGIQD